MKNNSVKIIDIETSGLLADMLDYTSLPYKLKPDAKLHVVVIRDAFTDKVSVANQEEITKEWMKESLKDCEFLIQHNGIKFDLIALKLFGVLDYSIGYLDEDDTLFGNKVKIIDTLIWSRLFYPDRPKGHSLASWGEKTGCAKMDFRGELIEKKLIPKDSEKGFEFRNYTSLMTDYCIIDTEVNKKAFFALVKEKGKYNGWNQAIKIENKLADLAVRRETFGFWFDKKLALKCLKDLTFKMSELQNRVNPLLPPKPMNKSELNHYTPPKIQIKKDGSLSTHMINFIKRLKLKLTYDETCFIEFEGVKHQLPYHEPLKTHLPADISNLDHVKTTLIDDYGWIPIEWAERDFTRDSEKISLPYDKRVTALKRWLKETSDGKYKKLRLEIAFENHKVTSIGELEEKLLVKLESDFPVRLPTSPKIKVGVEKDLCPNLTKLGEKVDFANDFALYLTYKHRKSSIAGGEVEEMDFDIEYPNSGFLSMYREEDERVPTPAIEIGSATNRYRHISICNIARASSIYGKEMRSLFGCGKGFIQLGFDYSSLENRVQGGYVKPYTNGEELAEMLLAPKPADLHSRNSQKLGISRSDAKAFGYAILYGASANKLSKMLGVSLNKAEELYEEFWKAVPALKELKDALVKEWESNNKKWIRAIDGRKIFLRSLHSLLNFLFQSGGVICAKYTTVFLMEELEKQGYCIDCFVGKPDIAEMISYHDEAQLAIAKNLMKIKVFDSEENAKTFIKEWDGKGQLSTIKQSNDKWYVALPTVTSLAIEKATKRTEKLLDLKFSLDFEYDVHKNWYGCH